MRRTLNSLLLTAALLLLCAPVWAQPAAQGASPLSSSGAIKQVPLDRWLGQLNRPFIIGLAGDSGSGKSTFARGLQQTLGKDRVKIICGDDYHRLDRAGRKAAGVSALNHRANNLPLLARQLGQLRAGKTIDKPIYDHDDGTLKGPEKIKPAPIIIIEGLHPFATSALRKQIDLSIYFDPKASVKNAWKIKRDVGERGHTRTAVVKSIKARVPDYKQFVEPQRTKADVLVQFGWSRTTKDGLAVKLRHQNQRPVSKRVRVNASGKGFTLRGERRRDGSGVVTLDGPVPVLGRLDRLVKRATGIKNPQVRRRSETLDAARLLVASRVMKEIVRAGRPARTTRGTKARSFRYSPRRPLRAVAR